MCVAETVSAVSDCDEPRFRYVSGAATEPRRSETIYFFANQLRILAMKALMTPPYSRTTEKQASLPLAELSVDPVSGIPDREAPCERDLLREQLPRPAHELALTG